MKMLKNTFLTLTACMLIGSNQTHTMTLWQEPLGAKIQAFMGEYRYAIGLAAVAVVGLGIQWMRATHELFHPPALGPEPLNNPPGDLQRTPLIALRDACNENDCAEIRATLTERGIQCGWPFKAAPDRALFDETHFNVLVADQDSSSLKEFRDLIKKLHTNRPPWALFDWFGNKKEAVKQERYRLLRRIAEIIATHYHTPQ